IKLKYPQSLIWNNEDDKFINFESNGEKQLSISNAPSNLNLFDLSQEDNPRKINASNDNKYYLDSGIRSLYAFSDVSWKSVTRIEKVALGRFQNTSTLVRNACFIIITHSKFISAARKYGEYRKSPAGGGYDTLVALV